MIDLFSIPKDRVSREKDIVSREFRGLVEDFIGRDLGFP
jgi:hypothetical protein